MAKLKPGDKCDCGRDATNYMAGPQCDRCRDLNQAVFRNQLGKVRQTVDETKKLVQDFDRAFNQWKNRRGIDYTFTHWQGQKVI